MELCRARKGLMMWKCEKCGREFKSQRQSHYCGQVLSIDSYIADQEQSIQPLLQSIRETISQNAPDAVEKISWSMPTFWQGQNLIQFAAFQSHIGLYPGADAVVHFADRLAEYKAAKGTIQLPLAKPIDHTLIADIVSWKVERIRVEAPL